MRARFIRSNLPPLAIVLVALVVGACATLDRGYDVGAMFVSWYCDELARAAGDDADVIKAIARAEIAERTGGAQVVVTCPVPAQ